MPKLGRIKTNTRGYGLNRKKTWKRGNCKRSVRTQFVKSSAICFGVEKTVVFNTTCPDAKTMFQH